MALLFTGTSINDFWEGTPSSESSSVTAASEIAPYVTEGAGVDGLTDILDLATPSATIYLAFNVYLDNWDMNSANTVLLYNENDEAIWRVNKPQDDNTTTVEYNDGTSWIQAGSTFEFTGSGIKNRWDMKFVLDDVSGSIEFWKDGVSVYTYSGDTIFRTGSQIKSFRLGGRRFFDKQTTFSGVFVCDELTTSMEYVQTKPGGAGNYTAWTGAYTDVDENGRNDTDTIETQSAGNKATFTPATLTTDFDTGWDVIGYGLSVRAKKAAEPVQSISLMIRSGTTDDVKTSNTLTIAYQQFRDYWDVNPATGVAWTVAEAKAAEIGVESS